MASHLPENQPTNGRLPERQGATAAAAGVKPSIPGRSPEDAGAPAVLQVLPALEQGGVERGTLEMVAALAEAGWRPVVASAGGPMVPAVERLGGRHVTLPLNRKHPWTLWRLAARLADVVRRHRIDLVHARSRAPAWSAWLAAGRTATPFVTTFHAPYGGADFAPKRWYNSVMAKGRPVIAISEFIADHIADRYGIDPKHIRVVPRGVDPEHFSPDSVTPTAATAFFEARGIPADAPVVALPGRLTRWKGQTVLIDALARLGTTAPSAPNALAAPKAPSAPPPLYAILAGSHQGRTAYRQALETRAAAAGLAQRVRIVDDCADVRLVYARADMVVSASTDPEGFGRVAIEAQAMGRPIIATDHGGSRETVRPGETGWRVPPGDAAALAAALADVLALDREARAAIGAAGRAHVVRRYTTAQMQAATLAVYREVLERGSSPGEGVPQEGERR